VHRRGFILTSVLAAGMGLRAPVAHSKKSGKNTGSHRSPQEELSLTLPAEFPFEIVETHGENALAKWTELNRSPGIAPVVIGGKQELERVADGLSYRDAGTSSEDVLDRAAKLTHPDNLFEMRREETASSCARLRDWLEKTAEEDLGIDTMNPDGSTRGITKDELLAGCEGETGPELGDWPQSAPGSPGLTVAGQPSVKVYIALIPTDDWTTVPAHLNWGGWNANPSPEYHVAALRSWREHHGAELIGLSGDVMNLRIARAPKTRTEALALAKEHYAYCNDIVDQGLETLSNLAAYLMEADWWFFWWD